MVKSVQKLSNLCVRDILEQESFHTSWDQARMVPYGTLTQDTSKKWITFNDLESHRQKAEFVKKYQLAGIGVFTLDQDVTDERSGAVPFPFLWVLVKVLRPDVEFRMLSRIVCEDITEVQVEKSPQENDEDVLVQYVPDGDASMCGGGCAKSKPVEVEDKQYQNAPGGASCQPFFIIRSSTTTESTTTAITTTTKAE